MMAVREQQTGVVGVFGQMVGPVCERADRNRHKSYGWADAMGVLSEIGDTARWK